MGQIAENITNDLIAANSPYQNADDISCLRQQIKDYVSAYSVCG
jgi:hypothetical protein